MKLLRKLRQYLKRRQKPVLFEDLKRLEPLRRGFGVEAGTPIDRWYIERFLKEHASVIRGSVLEIAESTYTDSFGTGVVSREILHYDPEFAAATIIGDLTRPDTLPEGKIDCFICTQTFNFIFDVREAVRGTAKVLKSNGVLLGTVAGLSQISTYDHDRWGDFWRFTDQSVKRLLEREFREVKVQVFGNMLAAKALLDGIVIEELPERHLLECNDPDYRIIIGFRARKR